MAKFWCSSILLIVLLAISLNFAASVDEVSSKETVVSTNEVAVDQPQVEVNTHDPDTSAENRGRLIKQLFQNYDKRNYYSNTTLKFGLALTSLNVKDEDYVVEIGGWLRMNWTDPRLRWNIDDFGGETVFRLPSSEIWTPDISLYNTADSEHSLRCHNTNVLVYHTGDILWVPPCNMAALCNLTLDTAPYERQSCELKFGSWTFDGTMIDLKHFGMENVDLKYLFKHGNYDVLESKAERVVNYYSCCKEPYVTLDIHLAFQRKANTHGCGH